MLSDLGFELSGKVTRKIASGTLRILLITEKLGSWHGAKRKEGSDFRHSVLGRYPYPLPSAPLSVTSTFLAVISLIVILINRLVGPNRAW